MGWCGVVVLVAAKRRWRRVLWGQGVGSELSAACTRGRWDGEGKAPKWREVPCAVGSGWERERVFRTELLGPLVGHHPHGAAGTGNCPPYLWQGTSGVSHLEH